MKVWFWPLSTVSPFSKKYVGYALLAIYHSKVEIVVMEAGSTKCGSLTHGTVVYILSFVFQKQTKSLQLN